MKRMSKESGGRTRAAVVEQLMAVNNLLTEAEAIEIYNVLDAMQALLAVPDGQRIVVNKTRRDGLD